MNKYMALFRTNPLATEEEAKALGQLFLDQYGGYSAVYQLEGLLTCGHMTSYKVLSEKSSDPEVQQALSEQAFFTYTVTITNTQGAEIPIFSYEPKKLDEAIECAKAYTQRNGRPAMVYQATTKLGKDKPIFHTVPRDMPIPKTDPQPLQINLMELTKSTTGAEAGDLCLEIQGEHIHLLVSLGVCLPGSAASQLPERTLPGEKLYLDAARKPLAKLLQHVVPTFVTREAIALIGDPSQAHKIPIPDGKKWVRVFDQSNRWIEIPSHLLIPSGYEHLPWVRFLQPDEVQAANFALTFEFMLQDLRRLPGDPHDNEDLLVDRYGYLATKDMYKEACEFITKERANHNSLPPPTCTSCHTPTKRTELIDFQKREICQGCFHVATDGKPTVTCEHCYMVIFEVDSVFVGPSSMHSAQRYCVGCYSTLSEKEGRLHD